MDSKAIFILASERSGTNLLRSLLSNHSDIDGPVAPHFLDVFWPVLGSYGNLKINQNCERLYNDMLRLANHPYHNWGFNMPFDSFIQKRPINSFLELFNSIYHEKAQMSGKKSYVCKENHLFNYGHAIKHEIENVRFIYLYRDPRDHVASWKRNPLFIRTPYDAVTKWKAEQALCISLVNSHNFPIFKISYEELIFNSPEVMERLLKFLNLPIEESCYQLNTQENEKLAWNKYWSNLSRPIMKDNKGKFQKVLSPEEVNMVETSVCKIMKTLGYSTLSEQNWVKPALFGSRIKLKRAIASWKYRKHINSDMASIQEKMNLIEQIRKDARNFQPQKF